MTVTFGPATFDLIPFGLSVPGLVWMAFAILLAAFVRGYSGFGFSALTIAASSLVTNPLHFVAVVTVCEAAMTLQAWKSAGPHVDWRRVALLMAGAAIGLPLGLWALTGVPVAGARAVISAYVLAMCAVLWAGWQIRRPVGAAGNLAAGLVSGLANAPGMGGLPVAAFFAAQTLSPAVFRATLVAYFPLLDLYSAPLYWWHGLLTWNTVWAGALAMPLVALGNWLGGRHFLAADPQEFRRMAIVLLAGLALLGLVKAVM